MMFMCIGFLNVSNSDIFIQKIIIVLVFILFGDKNISSSFYSVQ